MTLLVIFATGHAPDALAWNRALTEARNPAVLSHEVDLSKHSGFLPVKVGDKQTGFYFLLESYPELAAHYPAVANLKVERPVVYSLGYGGDLNECSAVFYSASVLVEKFAGTAFDPQGGTFLDGGQLSSAAEECQKMAVAENQ
jgi:hypothetical protein